MRLNKPKKPKKNKFGYPVSDPKKGIFDLIRIETKA